MHFNTFSSGLDATNCPSDTCVNCVVDDHNVFDVHHHHDSNESDLDRMAERKNEAENVPTQLWLLFARNLREGGNINFEESTQIGTNDKKSPNVTAYF